jgi:hypothetical protein
MYVGRLGVGCLVYGLVVTGATGHKGTRAQGPGTVVVLVVYG